MSRKRKHVSQIAATPRAEQAIRDPQYPNQSHSETLEIATALQSMLAEVGAIRRENAEQAEEMRKLRQWADERDRAEERWQTDRQAMMEEWFAKAEAISPQRRGARQAQLAEETKQAINVAKARIVTDKMALRQTLMAEPKVRITRPGTVEMQRFGESIRPVLMPEVQRIGEFAFVFPPGKEVEVPKSVAMQLELGDREKALYDERSRLLESNLEIGALNRKWAQADSTYGATTIDPETNTPGFAASPLAPPAAQ